jgi:hypothetical protein
MGMAVQVSFNAASRSLRSHYCSGFAKTPPVLAATLEHVSWQILADELPLMKGASGWRIGR